MKMKNMLIGGMSLALVACISIGGTLAYFTTTTHEVKNTFTASDGIKMTLDEAVVEKNADGVYKAVNKYEERNNGFDYTDVIPDVENDKDPTVHITTVPAAGMDLYVLVSGIDDGTKYTVDVGTLFNGYSAQKVAELTAGVELDTEKANGIYKVTTVMPNDVASGVLDVVVFDGIEFGFTYDNNATADEIEIAPIYVWAYGIQSGVTGAETKAITALQAEYAKVTNPGVGA